MRTAVYYRKLLAEENTPAQQHQAGLDLLAYGLQQEGILYQKIAYLESGQPVVCQAEQDCHISISHCKGLAVCGISSTPIGVDAEGRDRVLSLEQCGKIAARLFSAEEYEKWKQWGRTKEDFFALWTLHESYGKMTGKGLQQKCLPDFSVMESRAAGNSPKGILLEEASGVWCMTKELEQEYILSVVWQQPAGVTALPEFCRV